MLLQASPIFLAILLLIWTSMPNPTSSLTDTEIAPKIQCREKEGDPESTKEISCYQYHIKHFGSCCPSAFDTSITRQCDESNPKAEKGGRCLNYASKVCVLHAAIEGDPPTYIPGACLDRSDKKFLTTGLKPYDRKEFKSFHMTVGKKCDRALWEYYMIKPVGTESFTFWEYWLMCPFDKRKMEKMWLEAIVLGSHFSGDLLKDLCLETPNIEFCNEKSECECYTGVVHRPDPTQPKDQWDEVILNFTQIKEGGKCGQVAGNPCAHNVKELVDHPEVYRPYCDVVSQADVIDQEVLDPLHCENDAGCWNYKKDNSVPKVECQAGDNCKCKCADGYTCNGKEALTSPRSKILPFLITLILGYFALII